MLIFILPAAFYLRLVKSLPMHSPQKIGVSSSEHPKYLRLSIPDFFFLIHALLLCFLFIFFLPQAAIFLVVGVIFMIGSLTLIVFDWIHNPPGSGGGH